MKFCLNTWEFFEIIIKIINIFIRDTRFWLTHYRFKSLEMLTTLDLGMVGSYPGVILKNFEF